MPTPLPDKSVTCSAVLNPGSKIKSNKSSGRACSKSCGLIPIEIALALILSMLIPPPSSLMVITVLFPRWTALIVIVPWADLLFTSRSSGVSMP